MRVLKRRDRDELPFGPETFAEFVELIDEEVVSSRGADEIFEVLLEEGGDPRRIVDERDLRQVSDEEALRSVVREVVDAHPEEAERFTAAVVDPETGAFSPRIIGQSAARIAEAVGLRREGEIRLLVVPTDDPREENPLAGEKMAPFLSLFTVEGEEEGLALCRRLLRQEGTGHTAIIHTRDEARARRFGLQMPASRILVNSPGSQGVCGLTTGLDPSFTLGCGYLGGNATSDNVTYRHLMNVKRLAHRVEAEADA